MFGREECWEELTTRKRKLPTDELQISAWLSVCTGQCQLTQCVYWTMPIDSVCVLDSANWLSVCTGQCQLTQCVYWTMPIDSVCVPDNANWLSVCTGQCQLTQCVYRTVPIDSVCVLDNANWLSVCTGQCQLTQCVYRTMPMLLPFCGRKLLFSKAPGLLWGEPSPLSDISAFSRVKADLTVVIQCRCQEGSKIHALPRGLPHGYFFYSQIKPSINFVYRNAAFWLRYAVLHGSWSTLSSALAYKEYNQGPTLSLASARTLQTAGMCVTAQQ